MRKFLLNPAVIFLLGIAVGASSKFFDIYIPDLGYIFSDIAVWILFWSLISIYSATKIKAVLNVFLFFSGMLLSYYAVAEWTDSSYSLNIALKWFGVAIVISLLSSVVWKINEGGRLSIILRIGLSVSCAASAFLLMDDSAAGLILNCVIVFILIYHLWLRKKNRTAWRERKAQG